MQLELLQAQEPIVWCTFHQGQTSLIVSSYWRQVHDLLQCLHFLPIHHSLIRRRGRSVSLQTIRPQSASPASNPLQSNKPQPSGLCLAWIRFDSFLSLVRRLMAFQSVQLSSVAQFHHLSTSCSTYDCRYRICWKSFHHSSCTNTDWNLSKIVHQWIHELTHSKVKLRQSRILSWLKDFHWLAMERALKSS